jgi:two-component system OmpR family response regulator
VSATAPLQVLVADSDEETRLVLKELLRAQGVSAQLVEDPNGLTAALREGRPQLVLLGLPPDLAEAERRLAAVSDYDRDLCVIALADDPSVETAVLAMKYKALGYLAKPVEGDALQRALEEAIEEKGLFVTLEQRLNREIGARLRARRGAAGLTLRQVANRTGLSISLISQIELGKSAASLASLYKLSRALRSKLSQLVDQI